MVITLIAIILITIIIIITLIVIIYYTILIRGTPAVGVPEAQGFMFRPREAPALTALPAPRPGFVLGKVLVCFGPGTHPHHPPTAITGGPVICV